MTDVIATARSFLFVPGDRPERFDKAAASGADVVLLDLEDAVAPSHKTTARDHIRTWLDHGGNAAVRINAPGTPWYDDDVAMIAGRAIAVMVPKAEQPATLDKLAQALPDETGIIPLIETATGIIGAAAICAAADVVRPAFGSVDLATELGVDNASIQALTHARSSLAMAAAAAGHAAPIDGVTTTLTDDTVLHTDITHATSLGYTAKLCIHPSQVPAVNTRFTPTANDIAWARDITETTYNGSVTVHDGQMIDRPVLRRAQNILTRAHHHDHRQD